MTAQFQCSQCARIYPLDTRQWRCSCGAPFDLEFEYTFPDRQDLSRRPSTIWRYNEAFPVCEEKYVVSMGEGMTPLVKDPLDGLDLWWKLEYVSPTGAVKDRGMAVLVSRMKEMGIQELVEDSSGNAGASMAAYCARAEIRARIFVPQTASPHKKRQIITYGARLEEVPGDREASTEAAHRAAQNSYYANQIWNPFFIHGTKTCAFEIVEQLGWKAPDWVLAPLGIGTIILSLGVGFRELRDQGMVDRLPRVVGVQARNCCPFYDAWKIGRKRDSYSATMAEGIAHANSPRFEQILNVIQESKGAILTVTEEEIENGMTALSRRGFLVEPTSAVIWAALQQLQEKDLGGQTVVALLTGSGLKSQGGDFGRG